MTRMPGMVRMSMSGITVIFTNGLDGEQLFTLFTDSGCVTFLGIIFGLQSDAAFYYLRLDQYSLSVGMFCSTCGLTRRPLGRLATASSSAENASRHVERGLVVNQS